MQLVDGHEHPAWKAEADRVIRELARSGSPFTAQDVEAQVGQPLHPNAMGARFSAAARRGLIEEVGYQRSSRASRHASRMLVWQGTSDARFGDGTLFG